MFGGRVRTRMSHRKRYYDLWLGHCDVIFEKEPAKCVTEDEFDLIDKLSVETLFSILIK